MQWKGPFVCFFVGHIPWTVHWKSSRIGNWFKITTYNFYQRMKLNQNDTFIASIFDYKNLPFKEHVLSWSRSSQSMQLLIGQSCVNIKKSKWLSWDSVTASDSDEKYDSLVYSLKASFVGSLWLFFVTCDKTVEENTKAFTMIKVETKNAISGKI